MKVHQIGEYGRTARGQPIVKLLSVDKGEKIQAIIPVRTFEEVGFISTCTRNGTVKRTALAAYSNINVNGIIALTLRDEDELVSVRRSPGDEELIIVSKMGMSIRFTETNVREMGRTATGVRGIKLREGDYVVAMDSVNVGTMLLVVTDNGYGKRTEIDQYPLQNRGGFGVKTLQLTDKTGGIVGARVVNDDHELMVSTKQGTLIRTQVDQISVIGRNTQGVRVIRLDSDDEVTAIARIEAEVEEEEDSDVEFDENGEPIASEDDAEAKAESSDDAPKKSSDESAEESSDDEDDA